MAFIHRRWADLLYAYRDISSLWKIILEENSRPRAHCFNSTFVCYSAYECVVDSVRGMGFGWVFSFSAAGWIFIVLSERLSNLDWISSLFFVAKYQLIFFVRFSKPSVWSALGLHSNRFSAFSRFVALEATHCGFSRWCTVFRGLHFAMLNISFAASLMVILCALPASIRELLLVFDCISGLYCIFINAIPPRYTSFVIAASDRRIGRQISIKTER